MHKGFELRITDTQKQGDRAVITVEIARAGRVVDKVYFYLARQGGRWLIDALDESRVHPEHYLSGKLPAAFRVEDLPQSAPLLQLGELITQAAQGKPEDAAKLHAQIVDTSSSGYLHLTDFRGATCKTAYYSEPLSVVALVFDKPANTPGESAERIVLYLRRQEKLWHVYARNFGAPSVRSLLIENRFYLKAPDSAPR